MHALNLPCRREQTATPSRERVYTVVLHPALEATNVSVRVPDGAIRGTREPAPGGAFVLRAPTSPDDLMNPVYRDPCANISPKWEGTWLAGFAPVGNTECVVVVQQRQSDTLTVVRSLAKRFAVWGSIAVLAVASGAYAGWRWSLKSSSTTVI